MKNTFSQNGSISFLALLFASFLLSLGGAGAAASYFQKNPDDFMRELHTYFASRISAADLPRLDTTPTDTVTPTVTPIPSVTPTVTPAPTAGDDEDEQDSKEELHESEKAKIHENEPEYKYKFKLNLRAWFNQFRRER